MSKLVLIKNDVPPMTVGKCNADNKLHAKLSKYEVLEHFNNHSMNMFIGKPRSGKSTLIQSLFRSSSCLKNVYHDIIVFQPHSSSASMEDDIFKCVSVENRYDELTAINLADALDNIDTDPNTNTCLIIDDMGSYLKDPLVSQLLKKAISNRRHLHLSIFVLVQTYYSIPKDIRKLSVNLVVFRVSKMEMETIFEECVEGLKKLVEDISLTVYDKPYNWLFINTDTQKLYRKFDKIIIKD